MPCPSAEYSGEVDTGELWTNWSRLVSLTVGQLFRPARKSDLVRVVADATSAGQRVKAVGSGLSFEAVAASPDVMVDLVKLNGVLQFLTDPGDALTPARRTQNLFHFEAGRNLFDINTFLDAIGLALPTLGGVQVQTFAGATSTGTHGSDVDLPPVHDIIQAIHLVTEQGEEVWIESASHPVSTDDAALRAAFATAPEDQRPCDDIRIIRDDDVFAAARCGVGRFGVVYAVVVEVVEAFHRAEWAQEMPWAPVRAALLSDLGAAGRARFASAEELLADPPAGLGETGAFRFFDLAFNPRGGGNCWVRRQWVSDDPTSLNNDPSTNPLCDHGIANVVLIAAATALDVYAAAVFAIPFYGLVKGAQIVTLASGLRTLALNPHVTGGQALAAAVGAVWEAQMGSELRWLMRELNQMLLAEGFSDAVAEGRRGPSWQISSGHDNSQFEDDCYHGRSIEIVFDASSRGWVDFIDRIRADGGDFLQVGWLSVRFSRRSDALLSMHNVDADMGVSVEVTSLQDLRDNSSWMRHLESIGKSLGGRPHWGQENDLRTAEVERLYGDDRVERWRSALHEVVGASVGFRNDYTMQRGLEPVGLNRQVAAVRRSATGAIIELCNAGEAWSPVPVGEAVRDTMMGVAQYFTVDAGSGTRANVVTRRALTTAPDDSGDNNLDALPETDAGSLSDPPATLANRRVTHVERDGGGTIWVANPAAGWAVRADDAWIDIRLSRARYFTDEGGAVADIRALEYLTTEADGLPGNNLSALPNC